MYTTSDEDIHGTFMEQISTLRPFTLNFTCFVLHKSISVRKGLWFVFHRPHSVCLSFQQFSLSEYHGKLTGSNNYRWFELESKIAPANYFVNRNSNQKLKLLFTMNGIK